MKKFSLTIKIGLIVLCSFLVILSFEAFQGFNRYKNASIKEKLISNKYIDNIKASIYEYLKNELYLSYLLQIKPIQSITRPRTSNAAALLLVLVVWCLICQYVSSMSSRYMTEPAAPSK